jgi:hypothetical protein
MTDRHAWDKEALHSYRCRRCGMVKTNAQAKTQDYGRPVQWTVTFERDGVCVVGKTPPCPGRLPGDPEPGHDTPAPAAGPTAQPEAPHKQDPKPYIHRGGCAFCAHWYKSKCTHPGYPMPLPYDQARDDLERCGRNARWWERAGDTWPTKT